MHAKYIGNMLKPHHTKSLDKQENCTGPSCNSRNKRAFSLEIK